MKDPALAGPRLAGTCFICVMSAASRERPLKAVFFLVLQLDLLAAIDPSCINPEAVTAGATEEEREMNARYIISIARKLGADIFLLWEDIAEVSSQLPILSTLFL